MMECPYCQKEIPGIECPQCGATSPQQGLYCMHCGESLEKREEDNTDHENGFDLEERVLCPDGTCTGIIVNGKCTECGKSP